MNRDEKIEINITLFKIIMFVLAFIMMQGYLLPWSIAADIIPLWANIIVLTLGLMACVSLIERAALRLFALTRKNDD